MAYGDTLNEKKEIAFVWFANAVASESEATPKHAERLDLARKLLAGGGTVAQYVAIDFATQGYTNATAQNDINNRLSALATNMIVLGL